jgi:putative transposase
MTRHHPESNLIDSVMQLLSEHGLDYMGESFRLLLNEAMKIERARALQADPYERSPERRGYANGFKPKSVKTRLGEITFAVPQVRGEVEF